RVGGRELLADERVEERRLAGLHLPGDGHPEGLVEPVDAGAQLGGERVLAETPHHLGREGPDLVGEAHRVAASSVSRARASRRSASMRSSSARRSARRASRPALAEREASSAAASAWRADRCSSLARSLHPSRSSRWSWRRVSRLCFDTTKLTSST